ncbi:MAG TPA: hypothetical protein D7H89_05620 [Candidatus Poseidoniales archaeon]|nr:MAG TPA: hypothetical protein D7H89_05620 [Candidatus Poseidoniales archaeon]
MRKSVNMRRTRTRRGGRGSTSPMDLIPSAEEMLVPSDYSDAYRLAVLLSHKLLNKDDWDSSWETTETSLRNSCLEKGAHPVWGELAQHTPVFGQFAAFPVAKPKKKSSKKKVDMSAAFIDPHSSEDLAAALDSLATTVDSADAQVALRNVTSQLSAGRTLTPSDALLNLEGQASVLSALLHIATDGDATDALARVEKVDKNLASELKDLVQLQNGQVDDWEASANAKGEHSLALRRRFLAWHHPPESSSEMDAASLTEGLELLQNGDAPTQAIERVTWWRLAALHREGKSEETIETLTALKLDVHAELSHLLPLVSDLSNKDVQAWLESQIPHLDDGALVDIICGSGIHTETQALAAKHLSPENIEAWEQVLPVVIDIYTRSMNLRRLSEIIVKNDLTPLSHPYETLLAAHLLAAGKDNELWHAVRSAREKALDSVHSTDTPPSFSSTSEALLMLFEGENVDDERLGTLLDKNGLLAFGVIRRALREGGSGIVENKELNALQTSIAEADLSLMEEHLFAAVIDTLRLNRVALMLQHGTSDEATVESVNTLLSNENVPTAMIHSVRHLVLEHDLGLPSLVRWYQTNDPLSPWHTLARASVSASKKDELNAARDYRRAGDHDGFDYEHKVVLYRKSLIHLAFAEQWKEAVELLEAQPSLRSAITKRFQLYLRVSFTSMRSTNEATRLLKDFVRSTKIISQENESGELEEIEVPYFAEDDLDMLKTYPFEHQRVLPTDPFCGRVTAAVNSLQKNRRRQRNAFDTRFTQLMQGASPSLDELYDLATEAAKEKPVEGLMFLERAQNRGQFNMREIKRLADAEQGLFSAYKDQIPNASRRYLRNLSLSPLVLIDTNVLVDALMDAIKQKLEVFTEASLDIGGHGHFHHVLLKRAQEGKIQLWLPKIVKQELTGIASDMNFLRNRFSDLLVPPHMLDTVFQKDVISEIVDKVLADYSTWRPMDLQLEAEAEEEENKSGVIEFFKDYTEIYEEITAMKRTRGEPARTVIDGLDVYPEAPDRTIMHLAIHLAKKSLGNLGTILVATRDSDFTLVSRALEERFGFGVAKNSRALNSFLHG